MSKRDHRSPRPGAGPPLPADPPPAADLLPCPVCAGVLFDFAGEAICLDCTYFIPVLYGDEVIPEDVEAATAA
jgi:hypothetical protein